MADADTPSVLSLSNGPLSFSERAGSWQRFDAGGVDVYGPAEQGVERAAGKLEEVAKRVEADRPKAAAERKRAAAGVEKAMDRPHPAIPQTERVPSPPKPEDYQKMSMGYLGAMVLLGAFGGKFIRGGGNAALSAFNGALKGWQEGNVEAYENASKEWKQKQDQVLDNNQAKLDEYRAILEDRNLSIQDQMDRYKLAAAKWQDKLSYDRAAARDWTGVGQLYDRQARIEDRARKTTQALDDQKTQQDQANVERANWWQQHLATPQGQQELSRMTPGQQAQIVDFVKSHADQAPAQLPAPGATGGAMPTEPTPGTAAPTTTAAAPTGGWQSPLPPPSSLPPPGWTWNQIDFQAAKYRRAGLSALQGFPWGSKVRQVVIQRGDQMAIAAGETPGGQIATQATVKGATAALGQLEKQAAAIESYGTNMLKNGDVLLKLAKKIDRTGRPVIERWTRAGRQNVAGDVDVSNFNLQLRLWVPEVARIATQPNLTGVLSDNARRELGEVLDKGGSAKMFAGIIDLMHGDYERRRSSIHETIKSLQGEISGDEPATQTGEQYDQSGWVVDEPSGVRIRPKPRQ